MNSSTAKRSRYVVVCVDDEPDVLDALVHDMERVCGPGIEVVACPDAEQALQKLDTLGAPHAHVPLVLADHILPGLSGVDLLMTLHAKPEYGSTRKVLLSARAPQQDVTRGRREDAFNRYLPKPWSYEALRDCVRALLTDYFVRYAPEAMERFPDVVDVRRLADAFRTSEQGRRVLDVQIKTLGRSFLANLDMSDEELERAMGAGIDDVLDTPDRRTYPAGAVLVREGETVETISILVSGRVELSRKDGDREVVFHSHSAGRIVGLLSLAQKEGAFFTCRAATEITVIPLSLEQLDAALQANPWLTGYFITVLLRSLARRSTRGAELQVEVKRLNRDLRAERDQLTDTLGKLESTQAQLVESEKMATLGQLSAGVAHELNNPIAAIQRATEFLSEDLLALLGGLPDGDTIRACMQSALTQAPLSTREQRQRRAALAEIVGSDELAQRVVKVGITTPEQYRSWIGRRKGSKRDRLLDAMERYHQLGLSLRNLSTCSGRVTAIVSSLRAYTRADQAAVANVDVHEGLEGTLLMFAHALREVEVEKEYGDLPVIECHASEINQVWTNIIGNALQAMDHKGALRIETDTPDADHVRVRLTDSGPGIPPENVQRVFDLNFTTKKGQTSFGLGMGLTICHQIITRHGGTIGIESEPGRTCFTIVLPARHSRIPGEGGEQ